jgi:chromosome partitioning protein
VIPRNVRLAEAPSYGKPVALYAPRSRGTLAYFELAGEFSVRNGIEIPRKSELEDTESVELESEVHSGPGS